MSAINGEGYGHSHAWVYEGSFPGVSQYRCAREECGALFTHAYNETPDIFKAIEETGISDLCPGLEAEKEPERVGIIEQGLVITKFRLIEIWARSIDDKHPAMASQGLYLIRLHPFDDSKYVEHYLGTRKPGGGLFCRLISKGDYNNLLEASYGSS